MYYPKSQIKTNLKSNEELIIFSTQETYSGFYYETSSGKKYTGKFPGDGKNLLLVPVETNSKEGNTSINLDFDQSPLNDLITPEITSLNFYNYPSNPLIRSIPKYYQYPPKLVPEVGSVKRYFCKKRNEYKYIEISKEDYNKLKTNDDSIAYDLYEPISITWEITNQGSNSTIIRRIERELGWIGFFDYVQILKPFDNGRNIKTG